MSYLNSAFIVGKRKTLLMAFLKSSYLDKFFVDKKTTIPTTFSQASFPFHSGTESGRELKAIRTVCSRTLLLSFFFFLTLNGCSFSFEIKLAWLFFSFCNYSFSLRLWKVSTCVCVCVCVCVWERERACISMSLCRGCVISCLDTVHLLFLSL